MVAQNKRFLWILASVAGLLLIPFIAMQFSNEVQWTLFDFIVAGGLLLATGTSVELIIRKVKSINARLIIICSVLLLLLLVWVELAVGVFGTSFAGS